MKLTKEDIKLIRAWELLTGGAVVIPEAKDRIEYREYGKRSWRTWTIATEKQKQELMGMIKFDIIAAVHNTRGQLSR